MSRLILICLLACIAGQPAVSADLGAEVEPHAYNSHPGYIALPPERHVVEVVKPPYGGRFIINGTSFTAKDGACFGWVAGDHIVLRAGDWHGWCDSALFYNVSRHRSCEMWCDNIFTR